MNTTLTNELNSLAKANYERMMAFDQALNATQDNNLKNFFEERAEESENMVEMLTDFVAPNATANKAHVLPATSLFETVSTKKSAKFLIESAKQLEKNMLKLYKNIVNDLKQVPENIAKQIKLQYKNLMNSQTVLAQL